MLSSQKAQLCNPCLRNELSPISQEGQAAFAASELEPVTARRSQPNFRVNIDRTTTESEAQMSERLETLKKARERMADDRDSFAKTLAAPFENPQESLCRLR